MPDYMSEKFGAWQVNDDIARGKVQRQFKNEVQRLRALS